MKWFPPLVLLLVLVLAAVVPAVADVQIKTPGTACPGPDSTVFWEQASLCPQGTLLWQRPAYQFGPSTSQTCNSGLAGMVQWTSTAASPNNTLQYCNGTSWTNFAASGSGILLGSSATATNPQATGDVGTGLFSATASTVSIATAGVEAMRVTATGSVGIGTTAPLQTLGVNGTINAATAYYLSASKVLSVPNVDANLTSLAIGYSALSNLNNTATSYGNTAVGNDSLGTTTTGRQNTAIGYSSLKNLTTAINNTAVGYNVLINNNGGENTAVGTSSLYTNTTGIKNTAIGEVVLYKNLAGNQSTAVGNMALFQLTATGNTGNTGVGYQVMYGATGLSVGRYNTAVGDSALMNIQSGTNNTAIGYNVGKTNVVTGSGNILIGTDSTVDTTASNSSNQLNIGNALFGTNIGTQGNAFLGLSPTPQTSLDLSARTDALVLQSGTTGQRPASPVGGMMRYNTTANTVEFYQNGGWVYPVWSSDVRLKTHIAPVKNALDIVTGMRPVFFDWDKDNPKASGMDDRRHVGFLAQELEDVLPEVVNVGADTYRTVEYGPIVAVAVGAVKEVNAKVDSLAVRNNRLARDIDDLKALNDEIRELREKVERLSRSCGADSGP